MEKTRAEIFAESLDGFKTISDAVNCAAIFNKDGLVVASTGADDMYEMKLGAFGATTNDISSRVVEQLEKGEPMTNLIVGTKGFVLVTGLPKNMVLAVSVNQRKDIGAIIKHSLDTSQLLIDQLGA